MAKLVAGGIVEKDNKYLLVQETKDSCKGMWSIPAGGVEDAENIFEGAKREIFEETGCHVEITGLLEIVNKTSVNKDYVCFIFDTKLIDDNIVIDGKEISDVKWFTYEELLKMKDLLREEGFFLKAINNKMDNKIYEDNLIIK